MNRKKKIARNIIVLLVLLVIRFASSYIYLTPMAAYKASERGLHYGPSQIIHVEDFKDRKLILGKYDRWISCNTVKKSIFFFWQYGGSQLGPEIDSSEPLNYTWSYSIPLFKSYGIINDDRISRVEVTIQDGTILSTTEFHDNMFLIAIEEVTDFQNIKAYDDQGNILYEEGRDSRH